nr:54s ribosomal protein yml6, mitochondrial [Quercus suber]
MAAKRAGTPAKHLFNGFRSFISPPRSVRLLTTEATPTPNATLPQAHSDALFTTISAQSPPGDNLFVPPAGNGSSTRIIDPYTHQPPANPFLKTATCTLHAFPSFAPGAAALYPGTHLMLPMRKDILHKAVIFEGDRTRQGTAASKHRSAVHGSGKKVRPQKGTGSARLGDKKSPSIAGGGVAHGPRPRDFSTELPRKLYDIAWRTALSYRFRMGQLTVLGAAAEIRDVAEHSLERYVTEMLTKNRMGRAAGRTLFITTERRDGLYGALEAEGMGAHARALELWDVDVKDLLELGRIVVERKALERMLVEHEADLAPERRLRAWQQGMEASGQLE